MNGKSKNQNPKHVHEYKPHKHGDNGVMATALNCKLDVTIKGSYEIEDPKLLFAFKHLLDRAGVVYSCENHAVIDYHKAPFHMAGFNCAGNIRANYPSKAITTIKVKG